MLIASCLSDRTMTATMHMRRSTQAIFAKSSCISSRSLVYRCLSTTVNTLDVPQRRRESPTRLDSNLKHRGVTFARMTGKKIFQVYSLNENSLTRENEYRIPLGTSHLTVPRRVSHHQWGFDHLPKEKRLIKLIMEVADAPRDRPWASKAIETDAAARLGIQVQHGDFAPVPLYSIRPTSVIYANAWVDFISRPQEDFRSYRWQLDRYPIFGPICEVFAPSSGARAFMDPDERRAAILKGEPLLPKWEFRPSHLARLAKYQAHYGTDGTEFLQIVDPAKAFDVGMQHMSILGSRGSVTNP